MKNIKFSIICPIYNRGFYIDAFVNTILSQTYDNFEVIFVDDGSTDDTSDKIKKNASKNKRIKYFRQKNSGPFLARKEAMQHIAGEYFIFLDSDDKLENNALKILNDVILNSKYPDIINYDFIAKGKHQRDIKWNNFDAVSDSSNPVLELFCKTTSCYLWDKCYRKSLLKNAKFDFDFDYGNFAEDTLMAYEIIKNAKSLIKVKEKLYIYNYSPNSLSSSLSEKERNGLIDIYFYIYGDINKSFIPFINPNWLLTMITLYRDHLLINSKSLKYKVWKTRALLFNKVRPLYTLKKMYFKKMKFFYVLSKIRLYYLSYIIFRFF